MKEKGMGRTRLGRFAAVTVPATALSLGFGLAIAQGAVAASLSAANAFEVGGSALTAQGLELSLNPATAATSDTDVTEMNKKAALVTLGTPVISNMCLAANQNTVLGNLGLTIATTGDVPLGTSLTMSADSVGAASATLPATEVGIAESELDTQAAAGVQTNPGGFGMESTGQVVLNTLNADAYALSLDSLSLSNLSIAPVLGTASCSAA